MLNSFFDIEDRVKNGVAVFDRERADWFVGIDTKTLEVARGDNCPLGQVYGNYHDRPEFMRGYERHFGFLAQTSVRHLIRYRLENWLLNREWRRVILARQIQHVLKKVATTRKREDVLV